MIRREEARLRSLFQRLLILSVGVAPAACSSAGGADARDASALPDATVPSGVDGGLPDVATSDAASGPDATVSGDAGDDAAAAFDALDPYGFLDSACDPQYLDGMADGSGCDFFESLPCGLPQGSTAERCYLLVSQCGTLCSHIPTQNRVCGVSECLQVDGSTFDETAPLILDCATGAGGCGPGVGRRPRGLAKPAPVRSSDRIGATLAEMAHLEAASVHAFRRLGAELASMRAPRALIQQAERSARDEVRHARVTGRLARKRGSMPAPVVVNDTGDRARSIVDFAVENAVEGCVRECFGALVATHQAGRARDPEIAEAMSRIARDETRHGALAWEVARWLAPRLDEAARDRVRRATRGAVASLHREIARTPPAVARELGLPSAAEGRRLLDAYAAATLTV